MCKPHFNYAYLKGFIKTYFSTQAEYARFLGISSTSLYERFRGEHSFSQDEMYKTYTFAKKKNVSDGEFYRLFFCE